MNIVKYFDELSLNQIEGYIKDGQEENLFLDFKLLTDSSLSKRDDRKNLAIALSGFANSEGGIIVWGVDARPNSDGVDVASELKKIENLSLLLSKLNHYTGQAVDPMVEGVLHKKIPITGDNGFAATIVPWSDSGPHMAKLGENRYYKRSGDSFYAMEHFDIEDMFGRRKKPKLLLRKKLLQAGGSDILNFRLLLAIENVGRGVAKSPFLEININLPYKIADFGLDGNGSFGLSKLPQSLGSMSHRYGASNIVIHPGVVHDVTAIKFSIPLAKEYIQVPDLVLNYRIAAEDMRIVDGTMTITYKDLITPS
jgi:hypothetical protein